MNYLTLECNIHINTNEQQENDIKEHKLYYFSMYNLRANSVKGFYSHSSPKLHPLRVFCLFIFFAKTDQAGFLIPVSRLYISCICDDTLLSPPHVTTPPSPGTTARFSREQRESRVKRGPRVSARSGFPLQSFCILVGGLGKVP